MLLGKIRSTESINFQQTILQSPSIHSIIVALLFNKEKTVTKIELIAALAEATKSTKIDAEKMLDAFTEIVEKTLAKGEELKLIGFGAFSTSVRAATTGRNPKTGAPIDIPERIVPKFKPGQKLKDAVCKCGCGCK